MASTIAIPNVPRMPARTPSSPTRPVTLALKVFSAVWMTSMPSATTRIVPCAVGTKVHPNTSWANTAA